MEGEGPMEGAGAIEGEGAIEGDSVGQINCMVKQVKLAIFFHYYIVCRRYKFLN